MTLDETIKYYKEQVERDRLLIESAETMPPSSVDYQMLGVYRESETNHKQLVKWLMELKQWRRVHGVCPSYEMCIPECKEGYDAQISECKRLLKLAMEDFSLLDREHDKDKSCMMRTMDCTNCPLNNDKDEPCHEWRYANEVKKLLGEEF